MEQKNMTAITSMFVRWYHAKYNDVKIFDDFVADALLTEVEKNAIAKSMSTGIAFFNPAFSGTPEQAIRWVVDNQLSPSPIGRAAFCENHLLKAAKIGASQYLILAAGYDSFAYRQPEWAKPLHIFEIDYSMTLQDKQSRLLAAGIETPPNTTYVPADFNHAGWHDALIQTPAFSKEKISFCSMLGISYYLTKDVFENLIQTLSDIIPKGSSIVFDYPDQDSYAQKAGERAKKQALLAAAAKEAMRASYAYNDIEQMLEKHNFLIYEHLTPQEITTQFFSAYNTTNPDNKITAFDNVNYCLAIKQ